MAGSKTISLQSLQLGIQTVFETAVALTSQLAGIQEATIQPLTEATEFESLQGNAPNYDVEITTTAGEASLTSLLLYQDVIYWFNSIFDTQTPTGVGPYTWAWEPTLNSCPTRSFYTLTYGDADDAYALVGAIVNTMTITMNSTEAVTTDLEFLGHHVETDALNGALTPRTVDIATAAQTAVFIDAFLAAFGGTQVDCTVFDAELELNSNTALQFALGDVSACDFFQNRWEGTLSMTMEFAGDGDITKTILGNMIGTAPTLERRHIRLEMDKAGDDEKLTIDFAGVMIEAPEIYSDNDGVTTLEVEYMGIFSSTISNWLNVSLVNSISAVPIV